MAVATSDPEGTDLSTIQQELQADFGRVAQRDGWARALMVIGWLHLAFFGANQWVAWKLEASWLHVLFWFAEVGVLVVALRQLIGPGWWRSTPLAGTLTRVWITFLIIAFNVATMNALMGLDPRWYQPVWTSLSTFGFATTAWICNLWFLVPAVGMYFVGQAIVQWPSYAFLIYGLAWWATLQGTGLVLVRKRMDR